MIISNPRLNISATNFDKSTAQKTSNVSNKQTADFKELLAKGAANANAENSTEARVDKADFKNCVVTQKGTSVLSRLSESIKTEIQSETPPQKIQAIKEKIAKGEYKINPDELASLILKI
ncbi:MAG: flagellar biosynthesis anti-sigma factor FlgM [Oscillospiraceae bacterium]